MAKSRDRGAADRGRDPVHDELCAALRGGDRPVSAAAIDLARRHRIHLVLADVAGMRVEGLAAGLTAELRSAALTDLLRERELRRLLGSLAAAGVKALLLKGAGLAHTVYRAPYLRPRTDIDM